MAQGVGPKLPIEKKVTYMTIQDMIAQGKSRQSIIKYLTDQGINQKTASCLYYEALKDMTPSPDLLDDYKKGIVVQNLDRLENIINNTLSGNTGDKKVALQAIDTLNKMIGAYAGNNGVTINKDNQGNEQIIIKFE